MTETRPGAGRPQPDDRPGPGRPAGAGGGRPEGGAPKLEGRPGGSDPIQRIFPLFALAMWIVAGFMIANDAWSGLHTLVLIGAALICSVTFVNFIYVFNYGYAASVVVLTILVLAVRGPSPVALALGVLLILFGLRLAWFVTVRYRSESYARQKQGQQFAHKALPGFVKGLIYVQTTTLQTFFAMSMIAVASTDKGFDTMSVIGLVLVAVGLVTEAVADLQKQRAKAAAPRTFVSTGLFARTRHPNYLGEIVFQVGVAVVGLSAAQEWFGHAAVVLAPLYIVVLMVSATVKGEQGKRRAYAGDPEFDAYVARTGALLPSLRG